MNYKLKELSLNLLSKELYDTFEIDRDNTLNVFESIGFKVVKNISWKKFGKKVNGVEVKIEL